MFEVLDLSGRALPQLKDICKQFGIDTKGLGKPELVMAIIGAQTTNPDLASKLTTEFPKKDMAKIEKAEKAEKIEKVEKTTEPKVKTPRIQNPVETTAAPEKIVFESAPEIKTIVEEKPVIETATVAEVKPIVEKVITEKPVHNHPKPVHNHANQNIHLALEIP